MLSRPSNLQKRMDSPTDRKVDKPKVELRIMTSEEKGVNKLPFSLTPQEGKTDKKNDFSKKSKVTHPHSTRNREAKTVDFLGPHVPDPTKIVLPEYVPAKYSSKRNGIVKAYSANTNKGIV